LQLGSTQSRFVFPLILLISGCAQQIRHQYELSPGHTFTGNASQALLVPINETETTPDGLEVGEKRVFEQLKSYLNSKGVAVETVDRYTYRLAANRAAESTQNEMLSADASSVSAQIDYGSIVPALLANLESDAELLIVSNMVVRVGESKGGRTVSWDGVKRRIDLPARWRMEGTETVSSIFVSVYHRDGTQVFLGYGGLDLLFAPNIREEKYELIPDRLQDTSHISEGICVAFYPYFGPEETCP
jgi:hypothetical protein